MPSDILTRLTQPRRVAFHNMTDPLCEEAAAIITALEAENASLRAEIRKPPPPHSVNDYTNRVIKVTTMDLLRQVLRVWRSVPGPEFDQWLAQRLERAERLP